MPQHEHLEGFVVDLICLRKYPRAEYAERARAHTRACSLEGHCIESGFGLVKADGTAQLLDPAATPLVVDAVRASRRDAGIWLQAQREERDGGWETVAVAEREMPEVSEDG